jgi:protocatechuate 3,4-dioxygenase beta subunit
MRAPVADVYVSVWDEYGFWAGWDFTDHDGKYEITLPAGSYKKIWFIPPEGIYLAYTYIPHIVVTAGQTTIVNVTLEEDGLISGKVTDEAGIGVADARIVLGHPILGWNDWGIRTDADGFYTTIGLPAGIYKIKVRPPEGVYLSHAFITDIVVVAGETTTVNVVLQEGGLISGRVTCPAGQPVAGARISMWDPVTEARGWAWTGVDGYYTTIGLLPGTYEMRVTPPPGINLAPAVIPGIVVTAGKTTTVNVTLKEGGLISGRVTDTEYNPAEGIFIFVWDEMTDDWAGHAWTADDGTFVVPLPPGIYRIFLQSPPGGPYLAPAWVFGIAVTAGEITTVDIILEPGGRVSGRITDARGVAVAGAGVRVNGWGTATDEDGRFTTIALLPGIYEMEVIPPPGINLAPAVIPDIVVTAGETTTVDVTLRLPGDVNHDGRVDAADLAAVTAAFNTQDPAADLNQDGTVDVFDLVLVGRNFGRGEQE